MDNKLFYTAIKHTIDYYRENGKNDEGFYMIKSEFKEFEKTDFDEYQEGLDYRKIFLRSYYRRFRDTTPSLDYEGKEIHWQARMVAEILFNHLLRQLEDKTPAYQYLCRGDITDAEYDALLEKHGLL